MALKTRAEAVGTIWKMADQALRDAQSAMEYAERTNRMHHQAICRLHEMITGTYKWPADK